MSTPYVPTDLTDPVPSGPAAPEHLVTGTPGPAAVHEQPLRPPVEDFTPTNIDKLRDDARPPSFPAGAPTLQAYLSLTRRERAAFMKKFAPIEARNRDMPKNDPEGGKVEVTAEQFASMMEGLADIEDLLAAVAVDEQAFKNWAAAADDFVLIELFNAYVSRMQLGEASRSAS